MQNQLKNTVLSAVLAIYAMPCVSLAGTESAAQYEYHVKTAFMYQFLLFVDGCKFQQETSEGSNPNNDKPIFIGIIGKDPFEDSFEPLKDKRVNNKKVTIKYFKGLSELNSSDIKIHPDITDIKKCDLIFISSSEEQYIGSILGPIQKENILTVADTPGFLEKGCIINFVNHQNKVRFEINTTAAKQAKLTIRSKLLRVALRVLKEDDEGEK